MKRFWVIVLLIFACDVCIASVRPVDKYGQLRAEGVHIVDQQGNRVALKGVSLGWHIWWPQFYNPAVVEYLSQNWHISVIRVAMGVEHAGGYLENPETSVALIKTVIDAAIANGIYVIIDWHSHDIYTEQAERFFTGMAQQYARYPNIIYEIFNEPERRSWVEIKAYSVRIIEAIRRYDSRNLIIVGTPNWSQDVDIVADNRIDGFDNIVYALHFYAATHRENIRDKAEYAIRKGIPLFVSECSPANAFGDGKLDKKGFSRWMKFLKNNDIGFVLWGLYDKPESSAMLKPGARFDGHWPVSQLSEMGYYARQFIKGGFNQTSIVLITCILLVSLIAFALVRKGRK